jgi:PAS domain S-box-containing protein
VPAELIPFDTKYSPRRLRRLISGAALAVMAIAGANLLILLQSYQNTLHEVEGGLLRQSTTLSQLVDHNFESADLVLANIADKVRAAAEAGTDLHQVDNKEFNSFLRHEKSELPQIDTLGVLNSDGIRLNDTRPWPRPALDASSREYFRALKANPKLAFFIGEPVRGFATGNWVVVFARPVMTHDGRLLGVVFASTVLKYFEDLFRSTALGDGYAAALLRRDGTLMARFPAAGTIGAIVSAEVLEKVADAKAAVSRSISPIDHQPRIAAASRLSRLPLTVVVTQSAHAALAPWRATAMAMGLVASLIILLIVAAAYLIARSWKQHDRLSTAQADLLKSDKVRALAEVELTRQREVAEQSMRLKVALENMSHGLCMFDRDQRLIVCNQKYADIYGLSATQTRPGTHVKSILRNLASIVDLNGNPDDYVDARLSDIGLGEVYHLTHKFRDGRVISVTHKPMAGEGWVATHVDVTEQINREESFRLLFDSSPVPMWVINRETLHFLAVNDAAIACYGYSRERFMLMTVPELRPEQDRERFANFLRALKPDQFGENIGQHRTADGRIIDVLVYSRALMYAGCNARLTAVHDITKLKLTENELRRTQKFLDAVIEHVPVPIMVKDVTNAWQDSDGYPYTLVNRAFEELFGVPRTEFVGKTAVELFSKEHAAFVIAENNKALRIQGPIFHSDHGIHTPANGTRICTATTVAVRDDSRNPQCLVTVLQDVTERKRAEDRIARMAHYDQLTNLANRRTFNESMETAIGLRGGARRAVYGPVA